MSNLVEFHTQRRCHFCGKRKPTRRTAIEDWNGHGRRYMDGCSECTDKAAQIRGHLTHKNDWMGFNRFYRRLLHPDSRAYIDKCYMLMKEQGMRIWPT